MPAPANVQMVTLKKMGDRILGHRLSRGDDVRLLIGGSEAYPSMLQAINGATRSIAMASYIFKDDPAGQQFVDALEKAMKRGVQVRVLIDFMGSSHGGRSVYRLLTAKGIPAHRFMPSLALPFVRYANLRNHRKLLIVDGNVGFTGGLNIDVAFWPGLRPNNVIPKDDVHFRLQGPVLSDLLSAFEQDWRFTTGEALDGETWHVSSNTMGTMHARGMLDGPDSDTRLTHAMILAALATAKQSVKIITPYFLPPPDIISALGVAAIRGVKIELMVPDPTNSLMVQWASVDYLQQVMEMGVKVWADGGDFNHSKIMVVDGSWVMFGSSNWDPRSLRLNFEFNTECHSTELAAQVEAYWQSQMAGAKTWKPPENERNSLILGLRNGIARLFVPML
jgi:cardiolipin synthase